jgi:glycosyltransferase involved in cell wall biosynthesis
MPKFSVIIPNYNHASFLAERIGSVLNQTFQDFELIILDDCSTDNSQEIIETYRKNPQVSHIVYNKQNSGSPFKQWERGIALAKSDWVWLAESDDFSDTQFLYKMVCFKEENQIENGIIFCDSTYVDEQSQIIAASDSPQYLPKEAFGKEALDLFMTQNCVPNASAVIFNKQGFHLFVNACTEFRLNGDWWLWSAISYTYGIHYLPEKLNFFRFHRYTARSKHSASGLNILEYGKLITLWIEKGWANPDRLQKSLAFYHSLWIGSTSLSQKASLDIFSLGRELERKVWGKIRLFTNLLFIKSRLHIFFNNE